jgi:quinol monooxygenase YgiN
MSVIMLQRATGDPRRLEEYFTQNRETIEEIHAQAAEHGLIAHRFYGSEGQILIADEWPDEESFALRRGGRTAHRADVRSDRCVRGTAHVLAEARDAGRRRLGA